MPKIAYEENTMRGKALADVETIVGIVEEYAERGYEMTLRQLHYQMVARGHTADWSTGHNTLRTYKRIGTLVDKARMCGLLDWGHIVDRTRGVSGPTHWDSPAQIIAASSYSYKIDKWQGQDTRVEVWVEKEALAGVISRATVARDVDYLACKGYLSQSAMWRSARRLGHLLDAGQDVVVLHLGDHDPSGIDMTRDNGDRLRLMIRHDFGYSAASRLEFRRIALTRAQVDQYQPPENPAKFTDSRAEGYVAAHGYSSWELDALPPDALSALINEHIDGIIDPELFADAEAQERSERRILELVHGNWNAVAQHVQDTYGDDD
jgi:hypothetical protein